MFIHATICCFIYIISYLFCENEDLHLLSCDRFFHEQRKITLIPRHRRFWKLYLLHRSYIYILYTHVCTHVLYTCTSHTMSEIIISENAFQVKLNAIRKKSCESSCQFSRELSFIVAATRNNDTWLSPGLFPTGTIAWKTQKGSSLMGKGEGRDTYSHIPLFIQRSVTMPFFYHFKTSGDPLRNAFVS